MRLPLSFREAIDSLKFRIEFCDLISLSRLKIRALTDDEQTASIGKVLVLSCNAHQEAPAFVNRCFYLIVAVILICFWYSSFSPYVCEGMNASSTNVLREFSTEVFLIPIKTKDIILKFRRSVFWLSRERLFRRSRQNRRVKPTDLHFREYFHAYEWWKSKPFCTNYSIIKIQLCLVIGAEKSNLKVVSNQTRLWEPIS